MRNSKLEMRKTGLRSIRDFPKLTQWWSGWASHMSVYEHIAYPHETRKPDPIHLKVYCLSLRASPVP